MDQVKLKLQIHLMDQARLNPQTRLMVRGLNPLTRLMDQALKMP